MKKRRNNHRILIICLLLLTLAGCKISKPKDVLTEAQMESLLYDYHLAKAMSENMAQSDNYKKRMYMDYVFEKNRTTEAIFDSSLVWYARHADVLSGIYERVNKRLKEEQSEIDVLMAIRERKPKTSLPGDSIDLWFMRRMYRLDESMFNNRVSFTIPSDSNFRDRDTLQWSVLFRDLSYTQELDSVTTLAIMAMAVRYTKNDTILTESRRIIDSGIQAMRLQADSLGAIKEVKGFIYFMGDNNRPNRSLFVDSISLIRYHSRDSLFAEPADTIVVDNSELELKAEEIKEEELEALPIEPQEVPERRINPSDLRNRNRAVQQDTAGSAPENR